MNRYLLNNGKRGCFSFERKILEIIGGCMIMNNWCKINFFKIDGDFEEKKSISDLNNINLEIDLYNKEKL